MMIALMRRAVRFATREDGAITADWVVLTAGIVLAVWAGLLMIQGKTIAVIVEIFAWVSAATL